MNWLPIIALQAWHRRFPFLRRNNFVWVQHGKFHDQLVRDLGASPFRKGWNVWGELFFFYR